jgi:outer membrane lipoprotein-sorting protein
MRKLMLLPTLLLLVLAGVLAGCSGQMTAPEIIQHLKDTAAQTQDMHMVVDLQADMTAAPAAPASDPAANPLANLPKSGKATVELWYKKPNLMRAEVKSMEPSDYAGAFFVNDGKTLWAYDPAHKMAFKLDAAALKSAGQMVNLPTDVQDILSDPNLTTVLDRMLSFTDAKVDGNEQVNGFNTYKLTLTPKADTGLANAALALKATMWVDQATWTVVKLDVTSAQGTGSYSAQTVDFNKGIAANTFTFSLPDGAKGVDLTMFMPRTVTLEPARSGAAAQGNASYSAKTVDFNKGVPDSTFTFQLPAGAQGVDLTMFMPRSVTLDQARSGATQQGFTLLTPDYLAGGATLTAVTALPMGRGYVLTYSGAASVPTFAVYEGVNKGALPGMGKMGDMDPMEKLMNGQGVDGWTVTTVQVRGVEGKAFSHQADVKGAAETGRFVTWQEKGSSLRIGVGGELSLAETLKIAESLK